jgi:hypothetical protein
MKSLTEPQKQWIWFLTLWVGGLVSTALLALLFRWVVRW